MDTKYKVFFGCLVLILAIQIYLVAVFNPDISYRKPYEQMIEGLRSDNALLLQSIREHEQEVRLYRTQIDSLEQLKSKKTTEYVNKYKEIDGASASAIVTEFRSIFAENDVK